MIAMDISGSMYGPFQIVKEGIIKLCKEFYQANNADIWLFPYHTFAVEL